MIRRIIAGQEVFDAQRARKIAALGDHPIYNSEQLCRFQQDESRHGIIPAEIVQSNYGYSLRYASGLQNFGLIASARQRQLDGTLEGAIAFAKTWQAADKDHRYVTMTMEASAS